ncbi:hypothetical protein RSAG8_00057, partial [Rhizoctonia solani AG-8 WAC10335]
HLSLLRNCVIPSRSKHRISARLPLNPLDTVRKANTHLYSTTTPSPHDYTSHAVTHTHTHRIAPDTRPTNTEQG